MKVLLHLRNAALYTLSYFFYTYGGNHIGKLLYGETADYGAMRQPWSYFYRKFKGTEKVVLFSCIDSRLNAFGQLFLHAYVFGLLKKMYGVHATFYTPEGPGPSVSKECNHTLAEVNRKNLEQSILVLKARIVVLVGHEHCAGDRRPNEDKVRGLKEFGRDAALAHPGTQVVTLMLYARLFGWRPYLISWANSPRMEHPKDSTDDLPLFTRADAS